MPTILIADDDQKIVDMLRRTLAYDGYQVIATGNGQDALQQTLAQHPDLLVLDWLMPELTGVDVARRVHAALPNGTAPPILLLTARDAIEDRVEGLDSGADDYLVKPFAPAEFLARVRALLRRREPNAANKPLTYADLSLDPVTRDTRRGDRVFNLSPREWDLLAYLLRHPRQVLPRDRLLQDVWGYDFGGDSSVLEVYIGYLRTKTEAGGEGRLIQTVRGVGYVLREA